MPLAERAGSSRAARPLSWQRGLLFRSIILCGTFLLAEGASLIAIVMLHGFPERVAAKRHALSQRDPVRPNADLDRPVMIHPYLGVVLQPGDDAGDAACEGTYRTTAFGFRDTGSPIRRRSPDRLIVVILGGSVARQFAWNGAAELERELSGIPAFAGRSIEFVRMATDGHKQPQQLMAVNYLLCLGGEFDLVINLDGVNEAALPGIDNVPYGVRADYPRQWRTAVTSVDNVEFTRVVGHATYLRDRQRGFAAAFDAWPWRASSTGLFLWAAINEYQERAVRKLQDDLQRLSLHDLGYGASGAPESFDSDDELYRHCVEIWMRSSIQLQRLCAANGAQYFHFLQPNQHAEPLSKPMESAELLMTSDESPFRTPVQECYPLMRGSGGRLSREGVSFCDLSDVFADHAEQIYVDDCCHITTSGDDILAIAIGEWIRKHVHPPRTRFVSPPEPEPDAVGAG